MWFLSYASGSTDRQTDRQTYLSQYFAPLLEAHVTTTEGMHVL